MKNSKRGGSGQYGSHPIFSVRTFLTLGLSGLLLLGLAAGIANGTDAVVSDNGELLDADAAIDGDPSTHAVLKSTVDEGAENGLVVAEAIYTLEVDGDTLHYRWAGTSEENVPYDGCDGRALISIENPEGGWDLVAERSGKAFDEVGAIDVREYVEDGEVRIKFEAVSEYEDGFWASSQVNVNELTFEEDLLPEDTVPLSMAGGAVFLILAIILGAIILRGAY